MVSLPVEFLFYVTQTVFLTFIFILFQWYCDYCHLMVWCSQLKCRQWFHIKDLANLSFYLNSFRFKSKEHIMAPTDSQNVFHLGVNKQDLNGATLAIIPGDPARVEKIAKLMDEPEFLASQREYTVFRAKLDGKSVVICSTGIGGPSTSIAVEELAQLGVRTFLRVGTTGAIQPHLNIGDMIVTTGSVRLDGASLHFAPMEFPAVADFDVATAMKQAATESGCTVHTGVTASSDTFYPGQERYDTFSGRVVSRFQGSMKEWQEMGVLNLMRWNRQPY